MSLGVSADLCHVQVGRGRQERVSSLPVPNLGHAVTGWVLWEADSRWSSAGGYSFRTGLWERKGTEAGVDRGRSQALMQPSEGSGPTVALQSSLDWAKMAWPNLPTLVLSWVWAAG